MLKAAPLDTGMKYTTFKEWLAQHDEGFLLPDRPPLKGMSRINALPVPNARRRRLHAKPVKKPNPFAPTIRPVAEIVPPKLIPNLSRAGRSRT